MAKGITRLLKQVRHTVRGEISARARMSDTAAASAGEGYNGGYADALDDVQLVLDGAMPNRNAWWRDAKEFLRMRRAWAGKL